MKKPFLPKKHEKRVYRYEGNIFNTYDSRFAKLYHMRGLYETDFELTRFPPVRLNAEAVEEFNEVFGYDFDYTRMKGAH